jgi:hypothetical protein
MSVRIVYYDKQLKKNKYKTVSIKKFDNDETKARQYLENWKVEKLKEIKDIMEQNKTTEEIKEIKEEIKEIQAEAGRAVARAIEEIKEEPQTESQTELQTEPQTQEKINCKMPLSKFKLELSEETGNTIAIFGSSKSGKTTQLLEIIKKHYDKKDYITLLIAENKHSKIYSNLGPNIIKMSFLDEELIKGLHKINKKLKNKYKFCIIFDDIILMKNSTMIMSLICTMRNAHFSSILLFQSVQMLAKTNRQNINGCIFKRQNNNEAIELIMKNYLGGFVPFYGLSMDDKIKLYREATKDYKFIYLNNLSDEIFFCNK